MKIVSHISGTIKVPVDGAGSDIVEGAVVMPGSTEAGSSADNYGLAIVGSGAGANAIGILAELHDYSVSGDSDTYTTVNRVMREVYPFYPGCHVAAEYDTDDTMAIASMQSTSQVRITSIEDHISGGWLYVVSATVAAAVGQLLYVMYDDATDLFLKAAPTNALTAADTCIKILPLFHGLFKMTTAANKLGTDAAAGTWTAHNLRNQMMYDGSGGWIDLDPEIHHDMQLLGRNPVFRSIITPINTLFDN